MTEASSADDLLAIKASAKSARDDGDWDGALDAIQYAMDHVRKNQSQGDTWRDSELADICGLRGGVLRRQALQSSAAERNLLLEQSLIAYRDGQDHENPPGEPGGGSYNLTNVIVNEVLLNPDVLLDDEMEQRLLEGESFVAQQTRSVRKRDPWAYCDLATLQLLRGNPDAVATLDQLDLLRTSELVLRSALSVLEPLAEVTSELRPEIAWAVKRLHRQLSLAERPNNW